MILAVLLTFMAGAEEEGEEEELEDEETGNGENAEAGMSTRAQTSRGGRRSMAREDQGDRLGTSARQNPNMDEKKNEEEVILSNLKPRQQNHSGKRICPD